MRMGFKVGTVAMVGWLTLAGSSQAQTTPPTKKAESNRGFDLNNLPLPVIEAAQKAVPNMAFVNVEKQSSWRRGQYFRIWAMDAKQRNIYLEVSASGKIIERPKLIKEKQSQTTDTQAQATDSQTK